MKNNQFHVQLVTKKRNKKKCGYLWIPFFSGLLVVLLTGCSVEVNPSQGGNSSTGPRQVNEQHYAMRLLDSQIDDPLSPSVSDRVTYPVSREQRVLLEFEALDARSNLIQTGVGTPITIEVVINGCGVGQARSVRLCPMQKRWGRMSTWNYFDTSYGYLGQWLQPGGDFVSSHCLAPTHVSGFDGYRCLKNDKLKFELNDWYRSQLPGSPFSNTSGWQSDVINQFVLIQSTGAGVEIYGDAIRSHYAPVLTWYE